MKKVIVEFNRLKPLVKTIVVILFAISIVSIVTAEVIIFTDQKHDISKFITTNVTFTAIMQMINLFFLTTVISKMSKKEANDRYLRKDIFNRLNNLEEELRYEKENILSIKKEISDIKKEILKKNNENN